MPKKTNAAPRVQFNRVTVMTKNQPIEMVSVSNRSNQEQAWKPRDIRIELKVFFIAEKTCTESGLVEI